MHAGQLRSPRAGQRRRRGHGRLGQGVDAARGRREDDRHADALHGTIGGGQLEYQAIDFARGMLRGARRQAARSAFALGASLGQCCGGAANLLFERVASGRALGRASPRAGTMPANALRGRDAARAATARLLVRDGETWGTLGDPALDARAAAVARTMLCGRGSRRGARRWSATAQRAVRAVAPSDFNVVAVRCRPRRPRARAGARRAALPGHMGRQPRRTSSRPRSPDNVRIVATDSPADAVAAAPPGAHFLVMTHSHALDFELVEAILERGDFAYCGLIGSQTKRRTFENGAREARRAGRALARLTCPIGIPGIKGKEPGAIAVAVAAQLLAHRERAAAAAGKRTGSRAPERATRRGKHERPPQPARSPRLAPDRHPQGLSVGVANDGIDLTVAAGRDPRGARRERRRQVDADEDHLRRREARRGRDPLGRAAGRRSPTRRARARSASGWCSSTSRCSRR